MRVACTPPAVRVRSQVVGWSVRRWGGGGEAQHRTGLERTRLGRGGGRRGAAVDGTFRDHSVKKRRLSGLVDN